MKRIALILATAIAFPCLLYMIALSFVAYGKGYGRDIMDWDDNGTTTPTEFLASADIGARSAAIENIDCIEYFQFNDGLPVKFQCEDGSSYRDLP